MLYSLAALLILKENRGTTEGIFDEQYLDQFSLLILLL